MKPFAALAALTVALATTVVPALAREGYVVDDAHLLSPSAVSTINQQVSAFNSQSGKEVVVVTTPSLDGQSAQAVAERDFAQQQVNGVMIFIAKSPKTIGIVPDRASRRFFPSGSLDTIRNTIRASFNAGNYDEGIINAVGLIINTYRSHQGTAPVTRGAPAGAYNAPVVRTNSTGGTGVSWFWWIVILAVIFFVIRGIFRAMSGPPMMGGPGYGPGPGPGYGPGYGRGYGPGYGPGYGGGGGFWSGLLGGLGGAWLGNELFGGRREEIINNPGTYAGTYDPNAGGISPADQAGFQSDPGQADMGNASFGGWGDSGGGGDWGGGGGGGDWGGGGGGDFGGGSGDGGGGW